MSWKFTPLIALACLLSLVSCSKSEPDAAAVPPPVAEAAPDPAPEPDVSDVSLPDEAVGPDATAVDPTHYTTEFENDWVRIVRIAYAAGEESVMHHHPDSVAVFLTDHLVQMTMPDGAAEEISASAGEAVFMPAGLHLPKNISEEAWELVLVEIKDGIATADQTNGPHATEVDPAHYTTEFENDRVRIVRIAYAAGEESVMHHHPDSVAVFLTDHLVEMTMPDGATQEISASAGEAVFMPAGLHLPKNVSEEAWELVLVEVK